jgi:hypothetical protein
VVEQVVTEVLFLQIPPEVQAEAVLLDILVQQAPAELFYLQEMPQHRAVVAAAVAVPHQIYMVPVQVAV